MRTGLYLISALPLALAVSACSSDAPSPSESDGALASEHGPRSTPGSSTEVWHVTHAWTDHAPSGKTFEDDYSDWVAGLKRVDSATLSDNDDPARTGQTLQVATPSGAPYQRALAAPTLECADAALFFRVTYASLNHLPFYVRSGDLYAGHFGIVRSDGRMHPKGAAFKGLADYEESWHAGQTWPSDSTLRHRHAYGGEDATVIQLDPNTSGGDGAWFDAFFLNKRVGYFLLRLVELFGSVDLAAEANMFHIHPEDAVPGDALVQRDGRFEPIGHTLFLYQVVHPSQDRMQVEIVSGSMPARQPDWEPSDSGRMYFIEQSAGGAEPAHECTGKGYSVSPSAPSVCQKVVAAAKPAADGTCAAGYTPRGAPKPYTCMKYQTMPAVTTDLRTLGGGIRRFRTPIMKNGVWVNAVPEASSSTYIANTNLDAIGARVERWKQLLQPGSPEERKAAALSAIEVARARIRRSPSSCSSRTRREDAFVELYRAMPGGAPDVVTHTYRKLEDYVFAELDYDQSKTCCWDSTKPEHFHTIMTWAQAEMKKAEDQGTCVEPPVFRASGDGDGFGAVRAFARSNGLPFPDAWSADEPCNATEVHEDTLSQRTYEDYCQVFEPTAKTP